ncbi:MAG: leucine-rich repeat protein [Clostridia bacterium]|nr:leucine-rich repeat protein [Clostridia bacterium]
MKALRLSKKLTAVCLSAVLLLMSLPLGAVAATADQTTADGFVYTVSDDAVTIKQYTGTAAEITVPETIDGLPVTTIGDGAFSYKSELQSVTLPNSITKICMMAFFAANKLQTLNIAGLTHLTYIGAYAFAGTNLSGDIVVPETVTDIGASAFSLTEIASLHLGKNVKPVSVQSGYGWRVAMLNEGSTSAFVAEFAGEWFTLENQKNIAMSCQNLKEITVDRSNPYLRAYGGVLFNKSMTELYCYPSGKPASVYYIPNTVQNFYDAFGSMYLNRLPIKYLGSFDLMDSNMYDGGWAAFPNNNLLKTVIIPNGVTAFCQAAFYNSGLESIFIPKSVVSIGAKAFWHCRSLTTVGFARDSIYTELPEQCFKDCQNLKNVTFGRIDYLSALAFDACTSMETVDLTNVLSLDSTAFDNCTSLAEVVYGDSDAAEKATVSASAFADTASLETVMLGSAVQSVEANAFANCANLKTAYISDEVESISASAFDGCESLTIAVPTEECYAYQYAVQNNIPVTTLQISPIPNQTYTGAAITPEFTVTASGKQLTENTDYEVFFKNNTDFGTASVTVMGKGEYSIFAAVAKFAILQRDLGDGVLISNILPQSADENGAEPEFALSFGNYILQKDLDYTVQYANNTEIGTATVTVTGLGNFTGTKTLTFEIVEAPPTEEIVYTPGDLDGNGEIALTDYALMRNIAIGMVTVTDEAVLKAGDLNGDTVVDFFDVALLDLKLNGLA